MKTYKMLPQRAMWGGMASLFVSIIVLLVLEPSVATSSTREEQLSTAEDEVDDDDTSGPRSGDLVKRVKLKLASDHRTLGNVSATLLSVQTEVDQTEQSMLGRVLDLQTARSFFDRHEEIDTSNDKLKADIEELNTQVEGLSSTLSKEQRAFLKAQQANRRSEGKLRAQILEDEALIKSMNAELAKEDDIRAELKKLSKIHEELLEDAVEAFKAGEKSVALLKKERVESKVEVGRHRFMRQQLVRMNNYSIACHGSAQKAGKRLQMALMAASKDSGANDMTLRQKRKANDASQQRLLAERALLISEVKRVEKNEVEQVARLKDLREDMQVLERSIVKEVREMQEKIDAEKERVKSLGAALMENSQAELSDLTKKEAIDEKIKELMKEVHNEQDPVLIATIEGQNDALQAELNEAYVMWKAAKTTETAAILNAEQAASEGGAEKQGMKLAEEALALAREEGRKKLDAAVKAAAKSKAKSQALFEKAQAAVAARCKPDWDDIWKAKRSRLVKCKAMEEELTMENAKKETLTQTLKAQAESGAA